MELIKKVRQAETQAQQIIDQAKADAASQIQENKASYSKSMDQSQQQRRETVEQAAAKGLSEGSAQAEELKKQATTDRENLTGSTGSKMNPAISKVMEYLKG